MRAQGRALLPYPDPPGCSVAWGSVHVRAGVSLVEDHHELTDRDNGQHEAGGTPDAHDEQARRMHPQYGGAGNNGPVSTAKVSSFLNTAGTMGR